MPGGSQDCSSELVLSFGLLEPHFEAMAPERTCDLQGLALEWDGLPSIREALRGGGVLCAEVSDKGVDLKTPSKYAHVLRPILSRMKDADKKLPSISDLRDQISEVLERNKREPTELEVDRFSWTIRKNLGFVKMKVRKLEVSIDPWRPSMCPVG